MYENRKQSLQRTISFSLSALLLMVLVIIFPFLSLNRSGLKSSMTVWEAATSLWEQGDQMISVATAVFIVFLPSLLILSLLYVTIPLSLGKSLPGMVAIFRVVSMLKPWAMVEVFFLGALVSLLKLVKLADIAIGVGFWAFALLMISMVGALGSVNYFEYWDRIEAVRERMRKETFS